jgi:four helix bundle protein
MFIQLKHKSLEVYSSARELAQEIYKISILLPVEEKFNLAQQIRRAALSVKLNLAEGCSRRSAAERKRFLEISRGSVIEIDAALETAFDLNYFEAGELKRTGELLNKCFAMLSNMIGQGV